MTILSWRAEALVLVIEHRSCSRCKSTFTVPSGLFIRMESTLAGYKRTWLIPPKEVQVNNMLPHERREVNTLVHGCQYCFVTVPENQLTFWPEKFQPQIAYSARIKHYEEEAARRLQEAFAPQPKHRRKAKQDEKPLTLEDL